MAASSRKLQIRIGLILGAMILVYGCYALIPNKFQALDVRLVDRLFVVRAKQEPFHHPIDDRIVHIDANLYFSRSQHAHVFRNLSDLGIAAQLIDFIFEEMVSQEEDQPLIQATRQAGNVYYGLAFESLDDSAVGNQVFSKISNQPETLAVNWRVDVTGNSASYLLNENSGVKDFNGQGYQEALEWMKEEGYDQRISLQWTKLAKTFYENVTEPVVSLLEMDHRDVAFILLYIYDVQRGKHEEMTNIARSESCTLLKEIDHGSTTIVWIYRYDPFFISS